MLDRTLLGHSRVGVEQGVHRIEFLERELRLERATRETAKSTEEDRVERETGSPAIATNVAGRLVARRRPAALARRVARWAQCPGYASQPVSLPAVPPASPGPKCCRTA